MKVLSQRPRQNLTHSMVVDFLDYRQWYVNHFSYLVSQPLLKKAKKINLVLDIVNVELLKMLSRKESVSTWSIQYGANETNHLPNYEAKW